MGKALADAGANVSFDSSDVKNYNEQMKQLQETANTTQEKLKEVQSATSGESGEGLLSGIDLNYDKASMSIDQLDSKIAELSGKREEISVSADTEEGQQAISALDNEIASLQSQKIMVSIGTQLEGGATVDELLAITDDAELAAKLQIDVSQVAEARQQLQTLKDTGNIEVPVTVKLDEGQFNSLIESLTGEAVEVPAEVETPEVPDVSGETVEYPSKVDTPDVPDVSGEEITYTATVDTPDLPDIQGGIAHYTPQVEGSADGETAEGTINYDKGTVESADGETSEGIINYDKGDVEKADGTVSTGTINYDLGTVAVPTGMVASGTINYALGTVATPGKAMGTFGQARAFAKGSLTDFPAYGSGHVSLPNDQKALVNEEYINGHSESIVRDGVWSLIPGGAHMENLKKGDIIFSAQQTEDLLKRGATPGHARAYAQGSLSDLSPLSNAFGSGFSGTGRNPWAGKNTSSSSGGGGGSSSSQQSWVKLNQLKGYASGIMRVPNDQLAWTQEQGEEAIVRNDGSILTPLTRDVSVLNADMTKNLWDFMGNPGSFLSDYSDGEKFGVKNVDNSSSVDVGGVTIQCNMPNVQNANDLLHELTTNKDIEKAICAMTIGRAMSGSSLAKYKYRN